MAGFYSVVAIVATYPMISSFRTAIASDIDPMAHLTVMRWYRTCLVDGRSPFFLDGIQHPFGVAVGNFPPMVLQTVAYLTLSTAIDDLLCYNILCFAGFLLTGLGTFFLAFRVVRDFGSSAFAGVSAMLGGPMMLHGHGHLELIYVGAFALFLAAWMRFVDHPGSRTMAIAAASYSLMTLSSSYFAVLAVIPAIWYLVLGAIEALRLGNGAWFRARGIRLLGFATLVSPSLLLTFAGQIWNLGHGFSMDRPKEEFSSYGVPWYGYLFPTTSHSLGRLIDIDAYDAFSHPVVECGSYLGLATLGLLSFAAIARVRFRQAGFWWSVTLILVILSFGTHVDVGRNRLPLPGSWIHDHFFVFRFLRVPARFNLLATVTAAVVAAAALKEWSGRWSKPVVGRAVCVIATAVAVADLSMIPFDSRAIMPMPPCYRQLTAGNPHATFLEVPVLPSVVPSRLGAMTGYWQTFHKGRTTGGYSAHANAPFDDLLAYNSPFAYRIIAGSDYLADPDSARFGIVSDARALDAFWLHLTTYDLRYVVLHRSASLVPMRLSGMEKLESLLKQAQVFEDEATIVFDRDRIAPPKRPIMACAEGWAGRKVATASNLAKLRVYNPEPDRDLKFQIKARAASREPIRVRLRSGDIELATWQFQALTMQSFESPTFRLPAGLQWLTVETDGNVLIQSYGSAMPENDKDRSRLIVLEIRLNQTLGNKPGI